MISALQHYLFCPRQCALAYIEMQWKNNYLTMKGNLLHEKAHTDIAEKRKGIYTARGLRLVSKEYAVTGIADVVEFILCDSEEPVINCRLPGRQGWWKPVPVEYKRVRPMLKMQTMFSYARRRCVWRKCSGLRLPEV